MAERQRNSLESRVKEIDKIIRCLYEGRVVCRITPERYDELACGYELEQTEIKQELESITARIAEMDMRDICVREFIANAKEIVDMDKLTPKFFGHLSYVSTYMRKRINSHANAETTVKSITPSNQSRAQAPRRRYPQ